MRDLMVSLVSPVLRLLRREERGAIGVLVAIMLGCGVLTGMGALVIDVGRLYQERAELQNGADAAALGVAKTCALGGCAPAVAQLYANANASRLTGGAAGVDMVCGSGGLQGCPAPTGAKADCPAPPPGGTGYVQVYTSTLTAGGSTLLPPVFARTLLGNSSYRGSAVLACAQAEWGAPAAATAAAVTISACEWDQATQQGASFGPPPPSPPNPAPALASDQVLMLNNTGVNNNGCATEPAGSDGPGSFGWVQHPAGICALPISGATFPGRMQIRVSFSCQRVLQRAQQNQTPILVPVYVSLSDVAGNLTYVLQGFADFVVTGYHMPGFDAPDWLNPANDCAGADYCLNGYFTQGLIPTTGSLGGTNLGASVIKLTG
jgi:Putative Flp pilus-assembly TadE/G-like